MAILFVSHFLDQVYEISDRITVLRNGQLVGEYLIEDLPRRDARHQDDRPRARRPGGDLRRPRTASVDRIRRAGPARPRASGAAACSSRPTSRCSKERSSGIAGLLGSGRTELVRLLYGADRADTGPISRSTASP